MESADLWCVMALFISRFRNAQTISACACLTKTRIVTLGFVAIAEAGQRPSHRHSARDSLPKGRKSRSETVEGRSLTAGRVWSKTVQGIVVSDCEDWPKAVKGKHRTAMQKLKKSRATGNHARTARCGYRLQV
jgi:hypothetical protein